VVRIVTGGGGQQKWEWWSTIVRVTVDKQVTTSVKVVVGDGFSGG